MHEDSWVVFTSWFCHTPFQLLHPLGENSPIESFLKKKPDGGMHHICIEVRLKGTRVTVLCARYETLNSAHIGDGVFDPCREVGLSLEVKNV